MIETIIVKYVAEQVYADTRKKEIKYLVQFSGYSDHPKTLMKLQTWEMPFDSRENASETLKTYQNKIEKGSFIIIKFDKEKYAIKAKEN